MKKARDIHKRVTLAGIEEAERLLEGLEVDGQANDYIRRL